MPRTVKNAQERKREIVAVARELFREQGYAQTSVESIIRRLGIAKGTFYHHFGSKEELLEAIVEGELEKITAQVARVVEDPSLSALAKLERLFGGGLGDAETSAVAAHLHAPANRELHELTNVRLVQRLSPLLARIIAQGNAEGAFAVSEPLATARVLLTAAQFVLDRGFFDWDAKETAVLQRAVQEMVERTLGTEPGACAFLTGRAT